MKLQTHITHFNNWVAEQGTKIFGTMIMTYLFIFLGLLPLLFPDEQSNLLYVSNVIQLFSLPLLAVGQNLASKAADRRSLKTYEMVKELINELDPGYNEKKKKR
jgi:hypothetical protein